MNGAQFPVGGPPRLKTYPMNDETKFTAAIYTLIAIIVYWSVFLPRLVGELAKAVR